jgi:hypothetical protein
MILIDHVHFQYSTVMLRLMLGQQIEHFGWQIYVELRLFRFGFGILREAGVA